ncbi:hypothetical protein EOK75_10550 [Pseudorhodobacter turbinis]|uniref:Uncharacterized protein n=1 Tax=Pseudorhodobacter turbinis TaxID=2500533 RepID=A0A4P8EG60_9RHOB|nr:hypothetical protein [Pseudorhodobacter turbinis]QCO56130.1 hypothetical protein EOK75_10550 [Pseudorhodobacter turbinis]
MQGTPFKKCIAILNVIAWAGFWAFGYLALTAETQNMDQITTAFVLAAAGGGIGIWAYLQLVRYAEVSGYAPAPKTADRSHLEAEFQASEGND